MHDPLICLIKLTYHLLRFLLCHFLWASHPLPALRAYLKPFTLILSNHLPDAYPVHLSLCWASSLSLFILPQASWRVCFTKTADVARIQDCIVIRNVKSMLILVSSAKSSTIFTIMSKTKSYLQPYFVFICFSLLYHNSTVKTHCWVASVNF